MVCWKKKWLSSFGEDKYNCVVFGTKQKLKKAGKTNITCKGIDIKQYSRVAYLGFTLDEATQVNQWILKH